VRWLARFHARRWLRNAARRAEQRIAPTERVGGALLRNVARIAAHARARCVGHFLQHSTPRWNAVSVLTCETAGWNAVSQQPATCLRRRFQLFSVDIPQCKTSALCARASMRECVHMPGKARKHAAQHARASTHTRTHARTHARTRTPLHTHLPSELERGLPAQPRCCPRHEHELAFKALPWPQMEDSTHAIAETHTNASTRAT
jgi:hypothetical protein